MPPLLSFSVTQRPLTRMCLGVRSARGAGCSAPFSTEDFSCGHRVNSERSLESCGHGINSSGWVSAVRETLKGIQENVQREMALMTLNVPGCHRNLPPVSPPVLLPPRCQLKAALQSQVDFIDSYSSLSIHQTSNECQWDF